MRGQCCMARHSGCAANGLDSSGWSCLARANNAYGLTACVDPRGRGKAQRIHRFALLDLAYSHQLWMSVLVTSCAKGKPSPKTQCVMLRRAQE